jgi:hypothetical protein
MYHLKWYTRNYFELIIIFSCVSIVHSLIFVSSLISLPPLKSHLLTPPNSTMKLTIPTPTTDFAALRSVPAYHCVNYEAAQLARKRLAYATLLARYERLLLMEEEGISVTVTMTSLSGTMTVQDDQQFEPMEYLNDLANQMEKLSREILTLHEKQQTTGLDNEKEEVADDLVRRQALALCLPAAASTVEAQPNQPANAKAA